MAIRLTVLGSGSAGNATCIEGGGARILLDAGFSCRQLVARLDAVGVEPQRIDAVVVTHEHSDHVRGAALFSRKYGVPVYCTAATSRAARLESDDGVTLRSVIPGEPFAFGDLRLTPFAVPHDAVQTIGCTIECNGARVGYATDLGHVSADVVSRLNDCDLLVLESNHDVDMVQSGPYPEAVKRRVLGRHGHLDNEASAGLASEVVSERTQQIVLAHLSGTNNRPDLAIQAAELRFDRDGRRMPALHPASQSEPSPWFNT
jgi:phosphoribosyl 1,2-cyclic phosphodiesterase